MELDKYPRVHPQVAARIMDGQALVVLADSGEVTLFSPVGTRIWELIDGRHTVAAIIETIAAEYAVAPDQARKDVQDFLQELLDARAVLLDAQPI